MVREQRLSERRACRLVGLSRDSCQHPPTTDQATQDLHEKIVEIEHMRRRKRSKRPINERAPLQLARTFNEVQSMDFVSDSLFGGRRMKYLTVADAFSHESVHIVVDFGISGQHVTLVHDRAALFRGYPHTV
jgi:putative transposase